jgi:hypothetical protein
MVDNQAMAEQGAFEQAAPDNQPRLQRDVGRYSGAGGGAAPPKRTGPSGPMHEGRQFAGGGGAQSPSGGPGAALGGMGGIG